MNRKQRRAEKKAGKRKAKAGITDNLEQDFAVAVGHHQQGRLTEAEKGYHKILVADGTHVLALENLAALALQSGNNEQAITLLEKSIAINPVRAEAYGNMGIAQRNLQQLDKAVISFRKALDLKPGYFEAHNNLANALKELGQHEEAVGCYETAITLNPGFVDARYNLANSFRFLGRIDESIARYKKVIAMVPDHENAWNNMGLSIKASLASKSQHGCGDGSYKEGLPPGALASKHFALLEYYLSTFRPHEADTSYDATMAALPNYLGVTTGGVAATTQQPPLFRQTVALLHFGRSGTGLMHSLIDNHPDVSTLPSIYLGGYFNDGIWEELNQGGPDQLPERFADRFEVLFDATSPNPVPGPQPEGLSQIGVKEGMTTVGDNRNEVLVVDRDAFCAEARRLIAGLGRIDAGQFLHIVHGAYERALNTPTHKHSIFYHIHNPNTYAGFNFLRQIPDARLMMMVRDPVQSCESWLRSSGANDNYTKHCLRIIGMLYDIDRVRFRRQDSVGVRLEDLKSRPEATMRALCKWIGIEESPTLYEMTAQGKKWWGDPTSPDYDNKKQMSPFDDTCVKRTVGSVFGERDRLVLETLFYPFSVRFGYREPDPDGFKRDLKQARAILGDLLDFELAIIDRTGTDPQQFRRGGNFLMLRAAMTDRLDVLDDPGTYPHMLKPLINVPK